MKKTICILLVLCLIGAAGIGYDFAVTKRLRAPAAQAEAAPITTPEPVSVRSLDYEALYALYEPDEVVMTIGGRDVSWAEYFYAFYRQASSVENYFTTMAMYGIGGDWTDEVQDGETYFDLVREGADSYLQSLLAMEGFAEEHGVELDMGDSDTIAEKTVADMEATCGEGATREEFDAYLSSLYLPPALYDRMNELSVKYQKGFTMLYGENGADMDDAEALAYLESNGYLAANHILFMTIDPSTGEALDEAIVADKLAQAQAVAAELREITDTEALLARFAELKTELDEDTGKVAYPNGYVFQPGDMVPEFEAAVTAQAPYEVSDPVESSYGYHVILTLPLDPDAVVQYSSSGTPMTARSMASNEAYSQAVDAYTQAQEIVYAEGFALPALEEYLIG